MTKAIIAFIVTIISGCIGLVAGHELLGGFPEFGSIVAVAVMGALIILFSEKKK